MRETVYTSVKYLLVINISIKHVSDFMAYNKCYFFDFKSFNHSA